jgi:adenylate cyclase
MPVFENISIGINFGEIIAGDIGSSSRKNYTVIGDNVNIASRLEYLCKKHKTSLIISESTYLNLSSLEQINFKFLGNVVLRGKAEAFKVYNKI